MSVQEGVASAEGLAALLAVLRPGPARTRAELMASTGLARSTVTQRLDALQRAGLVVPAGESLSTGGRPPGRFAFHAAGGTLLVADVGASAMRAARCDLSGRVLDDRTRSQDVAAGPEEVLGHVAELFEDLLVAATAPPRVRGVAVSVPGPVEFASGRVVSPPIMTGWDGYAIPDRFTTTYACTVMVDNDVNAMAVGEQRVCYPDEEHLLMVKVGTGVGTGIVAGGQVLRGALGAAGDLGHVHITLPDVAPADEPVCRCGNRGCVEAYSGGWALVRDLRAAGLAVASVDDAVAAVRSGAPEAVRAARRAGRILGEAVAGAVNLLNPSVVVVGGQLARAEEHLLAGVREVVYRRSLPLASRSLRIMRSRLDVHAGVTGLALSLADTLLTPERLAAL